MVQPDEVRTAGQTASAAGLFGPGCGGAAGTGGAGLRFPVFRIRGCTRRIRNEEATE